MTGALSDVGSARWASVVAVLRKSNATEARQTRIPMSHYTYGFFERSICVGR
jgi:hypothetical protein